MDSRLTRQSRSHFYRVLDFANMMHDEKAIANACTHISAYHQIVGELDSALYYASKPLSFVNVLDSPMVAIIYNNLAVVQSSLLKAGLEVKTRRLLVMSPSSSTLTFSGWNKRNCTVESFCTLAIVPR